MPGPTHEVAHGDIPELLAPAGSMEALQAAIAAGADAVYLGGRKFGARHYAANFSITEIREAVEHAHLKGVRVYVTVNTLVWEDELPEALEYLFSLYRMGVDAVLLQDIGLLACARERIPGLALHASTQCTISTTEGVAWAASAGFSRVVLARETPLSELDRILTLPRGDRPGIEVFVHGALCYAYSGQCLLSSVIGGRSGNRGMCAQPCRKPYRLVQGEPDPYGRLTRLSEVSIPERFILSTRDLCSYPALDVLAAKGIDALKIEGRMRSPEYVAAVVRAYRKALDALKEKRDWFSQRDMDEVSAAFNRGFTKGYLLGERGPAIMGRDRPDHRGLFLGTVVATPPGGGLLVAPSSAYQPVAGDGVLLEDRSGSITAGYPLNRDAERRGDLLFMTGDSKRARPGTRVFLTRSTQLSSRLKETLRPGSRRFRIPARIAVRLVPGMPVEATAACRGPRGGKIQVCSTTGYIPASAQTATFSADAARRQLKKSGETAFQIEDVEISAPGNPFIPLGELNRVRRALLSELGAAWIAAFSPDPGMLEEAAQSVGGFAREEAEMMTAGREKWRGKGTPTINVYCATEEELMGACSGGCHSVCYEPFAEDWAGYSRRILEGLRYCQDCGVQFTWKWPRVTGRPFLEGALTLVPTHFRAGVSRVMVEELGMAEAVQSLAQGMEIYGGQGLNISNAYAARALCPPLTRLTLSPELSASQVEMILAVSAQVAKGVRYEIHCQGNLDAIVSEDRLLTSLTGKRPVHGGRSYGLKDETGRVFLVWEDWLSRTHIMNAMETCLIDRIPILLAMGVHVLGIDARGRGGRYALQMASLYREGLGAACAGDDSRTTGDRLKEEARSIARGGITAGHFDRGVAGYHRT